MQFHTKENIDLSLEQRTEHCQFNTLYRRNGISEHQSVSLV